MTDAIALYLGLTFTLAALFVVWVLGAFVVLQRRDRISGAGWGIVPVLTPIWAWRVGAKPIAIAIAVLAVAYVALQITATVRS